MQHLTRGHSESLCAIGAGACVLLGEEMGGHQRAEALMVIVQWIRFPGARDYCIHLIDFCVTSSNDRRCDKLSSQKET